MQQRVLLPPRVRVFERKGRYLYFDPLDFNWVSVNESGRFILERLRRFRTLPQVAEEIVAEFGLSQEEAMAAVDRLTDTLVEEGFLYSGKYRRRPRAEWKQREFAVDVYLHMTNDCNLKCEYCYNKSDREFKIIQEKKGLHQPILDTEEYKELIRRLIDCGARRLLFTGGEPLMRDDVFDLLEEAQRYSEDVKVEILTNAILIKGEVGERLCKLADLVTISLDGHERHLHEFGRGKNTFAPTIRGIRNLLEARARRGSRSPRVTIVPALTSRNISFMEDIYRFVFDDLGADSISSILFQAGDHQALSLAEVPSYESWKTALEQAEGYMQSRLGQDSEAAPVRPVIPRNHCGVGNGEFSIDPSGYVYPCQSLHFDEFICGNVRERDVLAVFQESPVMQRMRSTVVDRLSVCTHCDLKELCNGGCRATAYNVYRKFDAHNEIYCQFLEKLAVDKLWASCSEPSAVAAASN